MRAFQLSSLFTTTVWFSVHITDEQPQSVCKSLTPLYPKRAIGCFPAVTHNLRSPHTASHPSCFTLYLKLPQWMLKVTVSWRHTNHITKAEKQFQDSQTRIFSPPSCTLRKLLTGSLVEDNTSCTCLSFDSFWDSWSDINHHQLNLLSNSPLTPISSHNPNLILAYGMTPDMNTQTVVFNYNLSIQLHKDMYAVTHIYSKPDRPMYIPAQVCQYSHTYTTCI